MTAIDSRHLRRFECLHVSIHERGARLYAWQYVRPIDQNHCMSLKSLIFEVSSMRARIVTGWRPRALLGNVSESLGFELGNALLLARDCECHIRESR